MVGKSKLDRRGSGPFFWIAIIVLLFSLYSLTVAGTTPRGPLFDDGSDSGNNPDGVPAFFTYLGQFLDHDMTLDSLPLPVDVVDPNTFPNNRVQRLNLDSVYGNV